ncbi:MAG: OadG family protein [Erysipelotrichaceae bacterium]|nr:OadG family protein [Erysipelotrichaceae bacterium]
MMEIVSRYSGLFAIAGYSLLLWIIMLISRAFKKKRPAEKPAEVSRAVSGKPLDESDEDATVACLAAAIECRNECHKNVRIVSVREV